MYKSGFAIPYCQCTGTQPAQDRRDLQGGWSVIVGNEYSSHDVNCCQKCSSLNGHWSEWELFARRVADVLPIGQSTLLFTNALAKGHQHRFSP